MTVALTLSVVSYHVIANPKILETLRQEVGPVLRKTQSAISWNQLEQLPYLVMAIHLPHAVGRSLTMVIECRHTRRPEVCSAMTKALSCRSTFAHVVIFDVI